MKLAVGIVVSMCGAGCGAQTAPVAGPTAGAGSAAPAPGLVVLDHAPADALALTVRIANHACVIIDDAGTADGELHVPIGRAVHLALENPGHLDDLDVAIVEPAAHAHAPRGGTAELSFRVDRAGDYQWQCSPEPGARATPSTRPLFAAPAAELATYVAAHREATRPTTREGKIALGKKVYQERNCAPCHSIDGTPTPGPTFARSWGKKVKLADGSTRVVDAAYVADVIVHPAAYARPDFPPTMPSYEGQIPPEQLEAIAAYIESLGAP